MDPVSWNARGKLKQAKCRQKSTETTWRSRLFYHRHGGNCEWKEARGLATTSACFGCLLGGQFLGVRAH